MYVWIAMQDQHQLTYGDSFTRKTNAFGIIKYKIIIFKNAPMHVL